MAKMQFLRTAWTGKASSNKSMAPFPMRTAKTRAWFASALIGGASALCLTPLSRANLLLQYNFDNQNANDSVTPAANGTLINSDGTAGYVTNTPGGSGYAFSTGDGVRNYLTTGTTSSPGAEGTNDGKLDGLKSFTITAWIDLQAAPAQYDRIVSRQSSGGNGLTFNFDTPASGSISASNFGLTLAVNGMSAPDAYVTSGSSGTWMFLAVSYDGTATSGNVKFYLGGVSTAVSQLGSSVSLNEGALGGVGGASLDIAGTAATSSDRTPSACFDDLRIYGSTTDNTGALSQSQIDAVRAANVPEPAATAALLGGLGLLAGRRARRPHD